MLITQEFEAKEINIIKIFTVEKVPFYIPIYQRKYNWTFDKEVTQLIEDLSNFQKQMETHPRSTYYLGNIIVKGKMNEITEEVEMYELIDGQQRLTTILLLIKALKYFLNKLNELSKSLEGRELDNFKEKNDALENILFISKLGMQGGDPALKINNPDMHSVLYKIFINSNDDELKDKAIMETNYYKNYEGFKKLLKDDINNIDDWTRWLNTLKSVKMVRVALGDEDREIAVFESINSKGLPLNTLDLIRNYLFLVAETSNLPEDEKKRINEIITSKLEPRFTKSNGEKYEKKINRFFSSHIAKETIIDNSKEKNILYKAYKEMVGLNLTIDQFRSVMNELEADVDEYVSLVNLSKDFIKNPQSDNYSKSFLAESKLELYLPMFLIMKKSLREERIDLEEYDRMLELLDLHNVSLAVADKPNKDNRFLFKYIEKVEGDVGYNTLLEYLTNNPNNKSRMATTNEFNNGLINTLIYEKSNKIAKYILYRIENHLKRTSKEFIEFKYSLEHIFPQSDKNWKDSFDDEIYKDKYIHTLGNLTLVKKSFNSKLSNKPWEEKKKEIIKSSSLKLNEELTVNDKWLIKESKNDPKERAKTLKEYIDRIWETSLMDKVIVSDVQDQEEDVYMYLLSSMETMGIVDAIKCVLYKSYPMKLNAQELIDGVKELYDYVTNSEFDQSIIRFSREKIYSGTLSERLSRNRYGHADKISRHESDTFVKDENDKTWTISEEVYNKMNGYSE